MLKPKCSVNNPRALVYKRFTAIEQSESLAIVYETDSDGLFWTFDNEKLQFDEIDAESVADSEIRHVRDFYTVFSYEGHYFRYNGAGRRLAAPLRPLDKDRARSGQLADEQGVRNASSVVFRCFHATILPDAMLSGQENSVI